jgi:glycosyltransferase involved in cell wall biosynthesis
MDSMPLDLSLIIPVYNERGNLEQLLAEIQTAIQPTGWTHEMILVDDASTDGSAGLLETLRSRYPSLRLLRLLKHSGQTPALAAGFDAANGEVIVTLDADLQNDPRDIPLLVETLKSGYDVVSGWRKERKDSWLRCFVSRAANRILGRSTGIDLHDFGCGLKAYRRSALQGIVPYGEMHRILPAYLATLGSRITEKEVRHRPRANGKSKYGFGRTLRVPFDILAVSFLLRYSRTPMRALGGLGLLGLLGAASIALLVVMRALFWGGIWVSPLLFIATILALFGLQCIALGLFAEMLLWMQATEPRNRTYRLKSGN